MDARPEIAEIKRKSVHFLGVYIIGLFLLFLSLVASISVGAFKIDWMAMIGSMAYMQESREWLIIQNIRLPRAIAGVMVGANLAIAGAIMQAITRNPLASPQIFGINAGASLVLVIMAVLYPIYTQSAMMMFAFLGAALGGLLVYYMASGGGMTPVKLALAGITIHLFLSAIIESIIIFHEHSTEDILFWLVGAIDGAGWNHVVMLAPWFIVGGIGAWALSRSLTILSLGEEVARGLGQKITFIRIISVVLVIMLAGSAVAVAGPIGFIGLIIPHISRKLVGSNYLHIIPCSAILGAFLLVASDVLSRFISFPSESPVGIVTALIGGPFFLYLARKKG
ncbi:MAG: iron ABC transporter permease [Bacillaceae bacterium]|nr:iron ABC transporter permease [Bacillaceae bacterium]